MSPEFVSFLKGLLEKDPSRRLNWPELLDHPFITKTPEEILEMEIEKQKYSRWIGLNFSEIVEANISDNPKVKKNLTAADQLNSTVAGQVEKHPLLFEDFDHHSIVSDQDHEQQVSEEWKEWLQASTNPKEAVKLRKNPKVLDSILKSLKQLYLQLLSVHDKYISFLDTLKFISNLVMNTPDQFDSQMDILKSKEIPVYLQEKLAIFCKDKEPDAKTRELINQLIITLAFSCKAYYDEEQGIQPIFSEKYLGLCSQLLKLGHMYIEKQPQLATNFVRHIHLDQPNKIKSLGLLFNLASTNLTKNTEFYQNLANGGVLEEIMVALFHNSSRREYFNFKFHVLNVVAVLIHPFKGSASPFPWFSPDSENSKALKSRLQSNEFSMMLIDICFQKMERFDWVNEFCNYFFKAPKESITQLSILRFAKRGPNYCTQLIASTEFKQLMKQARTYKDPVILGTILTLNYFLIKACRLQECLDFVLSTQIIFQAFDENFETHPYVAVCALICLKYLIGQSNEIYSAVKNTLNSKTFFLKIGKLLASRSNLSKHVVEIEGTHYCCVSVGFFDGIFNYFNSVLDKIKNSKEELSLFHHMFRETKLDVLTIDLLNTLGPETQLNPKGLLLFLMFVCDCAYSRKYGSMMHNSLTSEQNILTLKKLLSDEQLEVVNQWPQLLGGGSVGAELLVAQVVRILQIPFSSTFDEEESLKEVLKRISNADIMSPLVQNLNVSEKNQKTIFCLVSKLSNQPEIERVICEQFFIAQGLPLIRNKALLKDIPSQPNRANVVDVLSTLCQFCRINKKYYPFIHQLNIYDDINECFNSSNKNIRAKICNLVGHMCRHSDFFYLHLLDHQIIQQCIKCCKDPDSQTRKFACFALGNAAFHNDQLYPTLKGSIPSLISLLSDEEERTRANASGALGNFARNSNLLIQDLIDSKAMQSLMHVAMNDEAPVSKKNAL